MTGIELTPEVIAFARAVVAQVDGPPPEPMVTMVPRILFNPRTRVIHNPACGAAKGCAPLTKEQLYAITDTPWGCLRCDSFNVEYVYDYVEVTR